MAAFLLPWRIPRCRHGGRLCFKIDLPLLCGALPDGRAVDGILVVTVDGGLMAAGDPSTPARGLDDDGRAQLPPWLLRSSRRAGGARRRLHLRWIEMGWGAPRPWLLNRPLLPLPEEKPLAWRCVGFL